MVYFDLPLPKSIKNHEYTSSVGISLIMPWMKAPIQTLEFRERKTNLKSKGSRFFLAPRLVLMFWSWLDCPPITRYLWICNVCSMCVHFLIPQGLRNWGRKIKLRSDPARLNLCPATCFDFLKMPIEFPRIQQQMERNWGQVRHA